jgi:hypothetical protein
VQRQPSGSPYWDHPVVLWQLVGNLDGNKPVVFDVGRDHPGMRTTTPLAQPLPAGQDLQAVVTTEFTKWGGGLLFHPMRVSTITHHAAFHAADLRPGMVDDHPRAWLLRNGGRAAGACMDTPKPGPVDRVAWPAVRILALLSVLLIPMALVEGRRYRRDHPPPPADPGGLGPPRREPRQGRERPRGEAAAQRMSRRPPKESCRARLKRQRARPTLGSPGNSRERAIVGSEWGRRCGRPHSQPVAPAVRASAC